MNIELSAEEISRNYEKILDIVKSEISDGRKEKLLKLYEDFSEVIMLCPASAKRHFHSAYPGGYVAHVLNVVNASLLVSKTFKQLGGSIDFTKEELVFSALNHDLGKIGDSPDSPYYIPNDSDWHIKNQGLIYKYSSDIQHMRITDRSLFLLQEYGIPVTKNEWLAIKCSDGLYDESNKTYLHEYGENKHLRTNLVNIIHWADHMSARVEWDNWRNM